MRDLKDYPEKVQTQHKICPEVTRYVQKQNKQQ
jgi:hypothetical protein